MIDQSGQLKLLNEAGERLLGSQRQTWIDHSVTEIVHPEDVETVERALSALGAGRSVAGVISVRVRGADGQWRVFEAAPINGVGGDAMRGLMCVARDVGEEVLREVAGEDAILFRQLMDVGASMIVLLDRDGVITHASSTFLRLIERELSQVAGNELADLIEVADHPLIANAIARLRGVRCREVIEVAVSSVGRGEMARAVRMEMVGMLDDPTIGGIAVTVTDLTELRAALIEAERLSTVDLLTGVNNRQALVAEIQRRLGANERFAVLLANLDYFRPVNDLYGYHVGDELLIEVAQRLERSTRPYDFVARLAGDEFVIIAPGFDSAESAGGLVEQIEVALSATYQLSAGPVRIGVSVGASVCELMTTPAGLLADADAAMRDVKGERRGQTRASVFSRRSTAAERLQLVEECRSGLARGEFIAHLQPIIDLRTRKMVRVEALVRWQHPRLGLLRPQAFMNVIEALGYDAELGNAVLDSACRSLSGLARNGVTPALAVNFAMGQLADPTLGRRVASTLRANGIEMSRLVVEITERALVGRRAQTGSVSPEDALIELHHRGASLSLDDYGTGMSSLSNLRRFPLSEIKIDRSFVSQMCVNPQDRATVDVIIGLARSLDLIAVAEGVETSEQLELLTEMGCDQAQGYFVGVPMSVDDLIQWTWI